jgi:dihydrofolate synthase/folylpolyglutamate synthase
MTYELALSYLASLNESRIKPGLERIREILSALESPHLTFPHILVGGTNGKGSVVSFLGSALSGAGYRTGLFTSPHLHRFEERIAIGNQSVTKDELPDLVQTVKDAGVEVTYFEFATAMALLYFARQKIDLAILEAGLGGSWDATNATEPVLSVITSVDLDHQKWLGHALEEVAREKSGIMRKERPVVVGPLGSAARQVVLQQAEAVGARVVLFGREFSVQRDADGSGLQFDGMKWSIKGLFPGLKGTFQADNAACALAVLETLSVSDFEISEDEAVRGIESTSWPGRFQEVEGSPPIVVDAAHNPAAVRALTASLEKNKPVVWLFSVLSDKDLGGMTGEMIPISNRFVLVPLDHPRGRTVRELEKGMPEGSDIISVSNVKQGIEEARKLAGEKGCVVVAGSVVLAGEVLRELGIQNPESRIQEPGNIEEY